MIYIDRNTSKARVTHSDIDHEVKARRRSYERSESFHLAEDKDQYDGGELIDNCCPCCPCFGDNHHG